MNQEEPLVNDEGMNQEGNGDFGAPMDIVGSEPINVNDAQIAMDTDASTGDVDAIATQVQAVDTGDCGTDTNGSVAIEIDTDAANSNVSQAIDNQAEDSQAIDISAINSAAVDTNGASSPPAKRKNVNDDDNYANCGNAGQADVSSNDVIEPKNTFSELDFIMEQSDKFHKLFRFPSKRNNSVRAMIEEGESREVLLHMANTTRPIVDKRLKSFIEEFLELKRACGNDAEKELYSEPRFTGVNAAEEFVVRCLVNRPVVFYTSYDFHSTKDGKDDPFQHGFRAMATNIDWLRQYISYDEIAISALISVSVPSFFINSGSRSNYAMKGNPGTFERRGVITGCVGARFERREEMEWKYMLISRQQNTVENGYGPYDPSNPKSVELRPWAKLYGVEYFPTFDETIAANHDYVLREAFINRFCEVSAGSYLNTEVYMNRMRLTVEPFLRDANERSGKESKKAHCVVVGLGLGVWRLTPMQTYFLVDTYRAILNEVHLPNIAEITFSWFDRVTSCGSAQSGSPFGENGAGNGGIIINFSKADPHIPLRSAEQLLVVQYAWDGNSYPGNEYWRQELAASGDPAAACSSLIADLQNPVVNPSAFVPDRVVFLGDEIVVPLRALGVPRHPPVQVPLEVPSASTVGDSAVVNAPETVIDEQPAPAEEFREVDGL